MNPDQFSGNGGPPEDVLRDDDSNMEGIQNHGRLTIPAPAPEAIDAQVREMVAHRRALEAKAREAATAAVKQKVVVSVTENGRIRKNGPCPCGSGRKFKRCCLGDTQTGEKPRTSPKAIRAQYEAAKRSKLRAKRRKSS